jgi:hypothetical protein
MTQAVVPWKTRSAPPSPTAIRATRLFVAGSIRTTSPVPSSTTHTAPAPVQTLYAFRVPSSMRAATVFPFGSMRLNRAEDPSSAQTDPGSGRDADEIPDAERQRRDRVPGALQTRFG